MRSASRLDKINIDSCIPALKDYFKGQGDVLSAMIYGSYGTPFQTCLSDVDLAVLFRFDERPGIDRILALEAELSRICREDDINVLVLHDAHVLLQFEVIRTGRLIYCGDQIAASDFHEYVFKVYGDFAPFYHYVCKEYDRALKGVLLHDRPPKNTG